MISYDSSLFYESIFYESYNIVALLSVTVILLNVRHEYRQTENAFIFFESKFTEEFCWLYDAAPRITIDLLESINADEKEESRQGENEDMTEKGFVTKHSEGDCSWRKHLFSRFR